MTLWNFKLQPGQSIFDAVVFAAIKAFVSGEMRPGDSFPSVRALAGELKIHPNTAHKVVQHLVQEGWLTVRLGVGTVVAEPPAARSIERQRLLSHEVEQLVVEAKRVGLEIKDVVSAIEKRWKQLDSKDGRGGGHDRSN